MQGEKPALSVFQGGFMRTWNDVAHELNLMELALNKVKRHMENVVATFDEWIEEAREYEYGREN